MPGAMRPSKQRGAFTPARRPADVLCARWRAQPASTVTGMDETHRGRVAALLADAAAEHASLMSRLPDELRASLPVDAQGVTQAIDHLATAAGLSDSERRALIRPHAVNPAVLHARVFGGAPLARETVIGSFVEGARVRAEALAALADTVGGEPSVRRSGGCSSPTHRRFARTDRTWSRPCAPPTRRRSVRRSRSPRPSTALASHDRARPGGRKCHMNWARTAWLSPTW